MKKYVLGLVFVFLFFGTSFGASKLLKYRERQQAIDEQEQVKIPQPDPASSLSSSAASVVVTSSSSRVTDAVRTEVNLAVPFTSQAPFGMWDALHGEACEEASVLMVLRYFAGEKFSSVQDAEEAIVDLVNRNDALGFPVDDTAEQIVTLLKSANPALKATLLKGPTEESIKAALNAGSLVIVPAAGRMLGNPYFSGEGPLYHMLVIRGFTKDGYVITNDPGTKRGENYVYRWSVLLNAIHDWNGGNVAEGQKVVVVVSR